MQFEEFRQWLAAKGVKPDGINTRSYAVRKLEQVLAPLGSSHDGLDAAYHDDKFEQLKLALGELRSDATRGGKRFRFLLPESEHPLNRLSNYRAWLGQYGKFLNGTNADGSVELESEETYWFVGAAFGGKADQLSRFLADGVWEISTPNERDRASVLTMMPGDRIAIKASFVQRLGLPFDNQGLNISVMRLKARGTITANPGDGERVSVDWDDDFEARDWYFYTNRPTIWRLQPGHKLGDQLIRFTFFDEPQDYDWFLNHSGWAERFSNVATPERRFWIEKTLVAGRPDRQVGENALGHAVWSPQKSKDGSNIYGNMLQVRAGDVIFHLTDNAAISAVSVASGAADSSFMGVDGTDWAGQPGYRILLKSPETLEPPLPRSAFLQTEPFASELRELAESGAKGLFYNRLMELNQGAFLTEATPTLLSILNRAYEAFSGKSLPRVELEGQPDIASPPSYTVDDALKSLFLDREEIEEILLLWEAKKNVVLQGPPGVGKSFASQKLAFALMGAEDRTRLGFVQFHQSYSYEDFVEGFRPAADGFELKPGKFVEFCRRAEADPSRRYVFIIDEINRGNLSKILGELMLLIESDKRDSSWAMPLASGKVTFHVPANVFIMGLMNTADRSLAVVDYALRRRFAFIDLKPKLTSKAFHLALEGAGVSHGVTSMLLRRIGALNSEIIADTTNLGPGFAIAHSFFCSAMAETEDGEAWFRRVVRTEVAPLLREYWFDNPAQAESWEGQLLAPM